MRVVVCSCYNSNGCKFEIVVHPTHLHRRTQWYSSLQPEFYLTDQAKRLLQSIHKPIAVITIAGVYRSGKSYLVNRLLRNKHNGFATGSSVQPVTRGLSLWGRPIPAQD